MLLQPCFFATSAPSGGTDGNGNLSLNESKLPSQSQTPFSSLIIQEAPPASQNENNSELDSRMHNFIKSFDPASAGMRLLLAERIDKVMIRSELKKKRRVLVDLAQCKQQISVSAGRWFFPAADESVFNSLCDGFDVPIIVDSGASCCISPHARISSPILTSKSR